MWATCRKRVTEQEGGWPCMQLYLAPAAEWTIVSFVSPAEASPEEFFVPYVWSLVVAQVGGAAHGSFGRPCLLPRRARTVPEQAAAASSMAC